MTSPAPLPPDERMQKIRRRNRLVLALLLIFVGLVFAYSFVHLQTETGQNSNLVPAGDLTREVQTGRV